MSTRTRIGAVAAAVLWVSVMWCAIGSAQVVPPQDIMAPDSLVVSGGSGGSTGGNANVTYPLLAPSGNGNAYMFAANPNSGMVQNGNTLGFTLNGNVILSVNPNVITDQGHGPMVIISGPAFADGSTPVLMFGNPNFSNVNAAVGLTAYNLGTTNAVLQCRAADSGQLGNFAASQLTAGSKFNTGNLTNADTPTVAVGNLFTGLFSPNPNQIGISTAQKQAILFDAFQNANFAANVTLVGNANINWGSDATGSASVAQAIVMGPTNPNNAATNNTIVIGSGAYSTGAGARSVIIGAKAGALVASNSSVAIGVNATVNSSTSVAIGSNAGSATVGCGQDSICIGRNTQASNNSIGRSIALGFGALNGNNVSAAIGANAVTTADNQIMLGTSAETTVARGTFSVGTSGPISANANNYFLLPGKSVLGLVSVGPGAVFDANQNVYIGPIDPNLVIQVSTGAHPAGNVYIGNGAGTPGIDNGSNAVGTADPNNLPSNGLWEVAIGNFAGIGNGAARAVAIGPYSQVWGDRAVAVGTNTKAAFAGVAVGRSADANSVNGFSTAVGASSVASGNSATAVGTSATVTSASGTALGNSAVAGTNAVSAGLSANANATSAIAIGVSSVATGSRAMAVGPGASVPAATSSTALGDGASVPGTNHFSTAVGFGAVVTNPNQIMLGNAGTTVVVPGPSFTGKMIGDQIFTPEITSFSAAIAESGIYYTNTGASGSITGTLPACVVGRRYGFVDTAAFTIVVAASGTDTILVPGLTQVTKTQLTSPAVGAGAIVLYCVTTGIWQPMAAQTGVWTSN